MDGNNTDRSDLLGKIEGSRWSGGSIPGVSWTYSGAKTITIVFGPDFDASVYQISDIIIAGGDAHSVCSFGYYFEAGDSVTISTVGLLLNNGGNPPDISHVTLHRGDGGPRPVDEPDPGQITITKKVVPADGDPADATPAAGWVFDATTTDGATLPQTTGTTTDPDGTTQFAVDFDNPDDSAQVTITETQQTGYTLLQQNTDNAVCTVGADPTPLQITDSGALGFTADVHPGDQVTCTVLNQETPDVVDEPDPGQITITKKVVPADGDPADATPAAGWVFDATTTDGATLPQTTGTTTDPDGTTQFAVDFDNPDDSAQVTITETQQTGYTLLQQNTDNAVCTLGTDPLPTTDNGPLGFTTDIHPGDQVTCTVLNQEIPPVTETEPASIDVTKKVIPFGGNVEDAVPASGWVFDAATSSEGATLSDTTGTTSSPDGSVEFTVAFDAELNPDGSADVTITENQQAGYTLIQQDSDNAVCTVGAILTPLQITDDGALGFTAELHPGDDVSCVVINQEDQGAFPEPPLPVEITVTKEVLYVDAVETVPGDGWTFDAATSTSDTSLSGDTATTGNDGTAHFEMSFDSEFDPDGIATLTVTEEQQTGFTLARQGPENAVCTVEPTQGTEGPGDVDNAGTLGFNIEVHPGDDVSCTVVNRELKVLENPGPTDTPTTPTGTPTADPTFQSQVLAAAPAAADGASATELAQTGAETPEVLIILGAILLLGTGTGLALAARRRKVG